VVFRKVVVGGLGTAHLGPSDPPANVSPWGGNGADHVSNFKPLAHESVIQQYKVESNDG
jgi:hypothetical protein